MSGGSSEYVMGVMLDKEGKPASGKDSNSNSNFIGTLTYPNDGKDIGKTTWTEADGGLQWPDKRYYDTYDYAETDQAFNRGIFGDATKELGTFYSVKYRNTATNTDVDRRVSEWNADDAFFVGWVYPWFIRGAAFIDGTDAGVFAFVYIYGQARGSDSFRVVLTP